MHIYLCECCSALIGIQLSFGIAVFAPMLVAKLSLEDCVIQRMRWGGGFPHPQRWNMVESELRSA